nr:NAD(P)-binding domain-containing protein [Actinomycetales bacterium]
MSTVGNTVGIIGAGKVGTALGRLAHNAGWDVLFSDVNDASVQGLIIETMVPGARLVSVPELAGAADFVIVAVPFGASPAVEWNALDGHVVVDAMNHWYAVDGDLPWLEGFEGATAELTQSRNPRMRVVKSLNHLGYHDMETDARPAGDPMRRALTAASDDVEARAVVARFIDEIGFDPLVASLADSKLLEPDGPVFGIELSAEEMLAALNETGGAGTARPA